MAATRRKKMPIVDADGQPTTPKQSQHVTMPGGPPGFFTTLRSNVKGNAMNVALGACTAVTAPKNRAGKTAVLDAFRLALTGKHPIGGRAVDLLGLTADGSMPWASLEGSTAQASFRFPDGRRTPEHTLLGVHSTTEPERLLPLVYLRDLLTLGDAKGREELFRRFGEQPKEVKPTGLSPEETKLWEKALTAGAADGDIVARLAAAGTWVRSHKRYLGERLKSFEEERQRLHALSLTTGTVTDDVLKAHEEALQRWERIRANQRTVDAVAARERALMQSIEDYQRIPEPETDELFEGSLAARLATFNCDRAKEEVAQLQPQLAQLKAAERSLRIVAKLREQSSEGGGCLVCGHVSHDSTQLQAMLAEVTTQLGVVTASIESLEQRLAETQAIVEASEEGYATLERKLREERARAKANKENALAAVKVYKRAWEEAKSLAEGLGDLTPPDMPEEAVRKALLDLRAAHTTTQRVTEVTKLIRETQQEQLDLKAVEQALATTLKSFVATVKAKAESAVNQWMPKGFRAVLALEDAEGGDTCRWEVVGTDGRSHPRGAASGAEWAALAVAIACAWSEGQTHRFLLLDDHDLAGFSAENVRLVMTTIQKAVAEGRLTQALVAWSRPEEIPTEGWSVVTP